MVMMTRTTTKQPMNESKTYIQGPHYLYRYRKVSCMQLGWHGRIRKDIKLSNHPRTPETNPYYLSVTMIYNMVAI